MSIKSPPRQRSEAVTRCSRGSSRGHRSWVEAEAEAEVEVEVDEEEDIDIDDDTDDTNTDEEPVVLDWYIIRSRRLRTSRRTVG
jgi:hypothetical protein